MPDVQRSSDLVEQSSAKALVGIVGGVICLGLGAVFAAWGGPSMVGLAGVLLFFGVGGTIFGIVEIVKAKKVSSVKVSCPYCNAPNFLTEHPTSDFSCRTCFRMIPVDNGQILQVNSVRCGFCNALNYWSARSFGLICEECSHAIPIAGLEGGAKRIETFATVTDNNTYDLVLLSIDRPTEELISCLQHMLALNRNQVKEIFDELPSMLLTGIPRMKADTLVAQLTSHGARAEARIHTE